MSSVEQRERDVAEDGTLLPEEKQVSLVATKRASTFRVHSEVASVTRFLLAHPAVDIEETRTDDGAVVACTGTLPIGLVDLKPKPRKNDSFSGVVSYSALRDREPDESGAEEQ